MALRVYYHSSLPFSALHAVLSKAVLSTFHRPLPLSLIPVEDMGLSSSSLASASVSSASSASSSSSSSASSASSSLLIMHALLFDPSHPLEQPDESSDEEEEDEEEDDEYDDYY